MITPELAKAVLGGEYKRLTVADSKLLACHIDIYELARKCRQWAEDNSYVYTFRSRRNCVCNSLYKHQ